ncbi:MAG: hypothetical protein ACR2OU_06040 [Thermomicrobiales bacterium]
MSWLQFWKRDTERALQEAAESATPDTKTQPAHPILEPPGAQDSRMLPLHMQQIVAERRRPADVRMTDPALRLARMKKQRIASIFDVDQGELAAAEDNPWTNRIGLLTDAMDMVHEDQERMRTAPRSPYFAVPATPIEHLEASMQQPFEVTFTVGPEAFSYQEELDWAERGHQMALPELLRRAGSAGPLVPDDTPPDLRDALHAHLSHSLDVFASDMRDRRLDQEPLPIDPTLADFAKPCQTCGGWTDWKGRCADCAVRAAEEMRLRLEERRLLDERAREAEERHRLTERLPMARRRLADLEAEMDALENELQGAGR